MLIEQTARDAPQTKIAQEDPYMPDGGGTGELAAACGNCKRLGAGALCAAEISWPTPAAATLHKNTCSQTINSGGVKPAHGVRR